MNELIGPVGCLRSIMDQLLFGRKLPRLAASGDSKGILKILEKVTLTLTNTMNHTKVLSRSSTEKKALTF